MSDWWRGFIGGAFATIIFAAIISAIFPAHSQAVPQPTPLPSSYTFTLTAQSTEAVYAALKRANEVQAMVTGETSPRYDAVITQIEHDVAAQKATAAKLAEKPKDEPKQEAKPN